MTFARTTVVRFNGQLSRQVGGAGTNDVIDQLNAYFTANPNVFLRDATVYARGYDEKSYGLTVTLMLQIPGLVAGSPATPFGFLYTAQYIASGITSVDDQTNAVLATGDLYGKLIPLSDIRPGRRVSNDWIFISASPSGLNENGVGNPLEAVFASPVSSISPGATGDAIIWTSRGLQLPGTYVVRNIGDNTWNDDDRNYAYWDWRTGIFVGMAACTADAVLTTSTSTGPI